MRVIEIKDIEAVLWEKETIVLFSQSVLYTTYGHVILAKQVRWLNLLKNMVLHGLPYKMLLNV